MTQDTNVTQTIRAAIDKLESFFDVLDAVNENLHKASADADLVEVLRRTIDAQLAILRYALDGVVMGFRPHPYATEVDLARAILGRES